MYIFVQRATQNGQPIIVFNFTYLQTILWLFFWSLQKQQNKNNKTQITNNKTQTTKKQKNKSQTNKTKNNGN